MEEALQDLKIRFELLEGDRKAYFETSQWAIKQNKENIMILRQDNKTFRDALSKLKKLEVDQTSVQFALPELEKQNQQLCNAHKKYDELLSEAKQREVKLKALCDQMDELEREQLLVKTNTEDSTQAKVNELYCINQKEIRMLENRFDKAIIKYNEAQSIRKTYEQIVKKLKEERLTFDSQLAKLDKLLKAKKEEVGSLDKMFKDANHAKEVAKNELSRFEQKIVEDRKQREKELYIRKEQMKQKVDFSEKFDRKVQLENARNEAHFNQESRKDTVDEQREKKARDYQEKIKEVKETIGVNKLNEVFDKIQAQENSKLHLQGLQQFNEQKLSQVKNQLKKITQLYEDIKFSTINNSTALPNSEKISKELSSHVSTAHEEMLANKIKYENASKLLTVIQNGVYHLARKIDIPISEESENSAISLLESVHKKITLLANNIKGKDIPESYISTQAMVEPAAILQVNPQLIPENNVRVPLKPTEFESIDEDDDAEVNEELLTREYIKKLAQQRLESQTKGKVKKTKKKRVKDNGSDSD